MLVLFLHLGKNTWVPYGTENKNDLGKFNFQYLTRHPPLRKLVEKVSHKVLIWFEIGVSIHRKSMGNYGF